MPNITNKSLMSPNPLPSMSQGPAANQWPNSLNMSPMSTKPLGVSWQSHGQSGGLVQSVEGRSGGLHSTMKSPEAADAMMATVGAIHTARDR